MTQFSEWFRGQPWGRYFQITVSGLALVGLLSYTFTHTGGLLSKYIDPLQVGYLAAFGIELAIVSLSLRIGDLHRTGQNAWFFYGVLIVTLVVSAIANVAEGFYVNKSLDLTYETIGQIDPVQGVIGLAATGLVPLIVFALSEIIGTDVNLTAQLMTKERKAESKRAVTGQVSQISANDTIQKQPGDQTDDERQVNLIRANDTRRVQIDSRREQVLDLLKSGMTQGQVADTLNVSQATIKRDAKALNGNGVH